MSAPARTSLVTGAGGFVGANLVRRLIADGHGVHALVRPGSDDWRLNDVANPIELHEVDLADPGAGAALLRRLKPDWVFHLAAHGAYSWQRDAPRIIDVNLRATVELLDAADAAGASAFVHAGSSSEYGPKDHPPRETELPQPDSIYGISKLAATLYCSAVGRNRGAPAVTLRLYSAYGPWEEPGRLIPELVVRGLDHKLPPLADPKTARDFVHVDDVCEAFIRVAASPRPGAVYNVGTGVQTRLEDIVAVARERLGILDEPLWNSGETRPWDTDVWVADARAAREELGWRPRYDFATGFAATVKWFEGSPALRERYTRS